MGGKIGFIIIIIIALGLGLYLYSSGAFVNGIKSFNTLISASSTLSFFNIGSSSIPHGPSAPIGLSMPEGTTIAPPSSGNGATTVNPADIPAGYTAAQISPYFQKVRIAGISAATPYNYGTITLDDEDYNSTSTIDVTGWEIKSSIGNEFVPQAVNLYDPTGLAPASDIFLKTGDTVYLYSTSAPFNLRLNECTGYMAHVADFVPALPQTCPSIPQSQLQSFSGVCQNYLSSLWGCQVPDMSSPQIPQTDYACMQYLENNFTYRSCFNQHSTDANFLGNQVWVWTGANIVNQYHSIVVLFDKNGLLVDRYSY